MRKLWVLAIKRDRWQPTSSSRLCSAHFTNEDYVHDPSIAERLGMKPFSRLLKPDAVPSLFAHNRKAENKLRGAFEKRRRKEIVEEALAAYAALSPPALQCNHMTPLCHKPVVKCHHNVKRKALISTGSNTYILTRSQGLMTEGPLLRNAAVQTLKKVRSTTTSQRTRKPLPSFSIKRSPSPKPLT